MGENGHFKYNAIKGVVTGNGSNASLWWAHQKRLLDALGVGLSGAHVSNEEQSRREQDFS